MGKLKDLWAELKECKPEEKAAIQKKINGIEKWMIENKIGTIKEITDWNKESSTKKTFRYEGIRMGDYGMPEGAYVGRDRCGACKWNKHPWCDKGKTKICVANV